MIGAEQGDVAVRWRRLGMDDADAAAALLREAHGRNLAWDIALPTAGTTGPDVRQALSDGAALIGAVGADGIAPVAMGGIWPQGEIGWLAVADRHAGQGFGRAVLVATEGLALSLGHDRVHLRTASAHPWLGAWYRRHGYVERAAADGACDLRLERDLASAWRPLPRPRCAWAERDVRAAAYHDYEWGLWVEDARDLFERLTLEVFQTGLSWRTVLTKRMALRQGLFGFDPVRLAAADDAALERFLAAPGVIHSPRKFAATVHNARVLLDVARAHGSFAIYLRSRPVEELYAELRPRLRLFGPSVARSLFESVGLVPAPHAHDCLAAPARPPAPYRDVRS